MRDLKTRTKIFNCDYCIEMPPQNALMLRVQGHSVPELMNAFQNPSEIGEISFRGRLFHGYNTLKTIRDEGTQVFIMLGRGG